MAEGFWLLVVSVAFSLFQTFLPVPDSWRRPGAFLFFAIVVVAGAALFAVRYPALRSARLVQVAIFLAAGSLGIGAWRILAPLPVAVIEPRAQEPATEPPPQMEPTEKAEATVSRLSPAQAAGVTTPTPRTEVPSAEEIADAFAKRLPTVGVAPEMLPPFSLGGSLAQNDLFDIMNKDYGAVWRSVKQTRDVEINWDVLKGAPLFVDALVRGGRCQLGLLDVVNGVVVATSDWVERVQGETGWDKLSEQPSLLEELKVVQFAIPPTTGRKTYRLVVRGGEGRAADTFWVQGSVTFPVVSLGGTFAERSTAAPGMLVTRIPKGATGTVDWSRVQDPITGVVAEVTLAVWYPVFQTRERARVLLNDTTDGTVVEGDWMPVLWIGGIMASLLERPYPGPSVRQFRAIVPRKSGKHSYELSVEVSTAGMESAARGRLLFVH